MTQSEPDFFELLRDSRHSAVHLEMRDAYGVSDEAGDFHRWLATGERDIDPSSETWASWVAAVQEAVRRGVVMRRARIVSEPVTDYIRYEHAGTMVNLDAGEQVRWLPRRLASDIALPGNDFWLLDGKWVIFNHFTGTGEWSEPRWEFRDEPAVAGLCGIAFESVWERGTPHEKFSV